MRFSILSLFLFPMCALLAVSCDSASKGSSGSPGGAASTRELDDFAKRSGVLFPPSAKAVHYERYRGMDAMINLTIEIPAADLAPFLKSSALEKDITNTDVTGGLAAKFGSFVAKIPAKFREGQKHLPGGTWLNVLVDEDSPTTVLVHLTWFEV